MSRKGEKSLIVGLDVGTSKIAALVGEVRNDSIEVIGLGVHPARGLRKGVVVNIESTVQSIQRAIEEAEIMAQCQIQSVLCGISGSHIRSRNSKGIVGIHDQEVTHDDVERVIDAARAVAIPADQRILHILPQEFIVDEQDGIREPIGMSGVRLETLVHMVTGSVSAAQNIIKSIRRCGLEVDDLILSQLASSYAVLQEDEKELGVCLIDIGGGTTDIAIYANGAIQHTAVIPIAGDQVTNDIAFFHRTPTQHAEEIKMKYACALRQLAGSDEYIEFPSIGDRPSQQLTRQALAEVVEFRYDELLKLAQAELRRTGLEERIAGGIVLTGGSAKMEGLVELAEDIFKMPARVGTPQYVTGPEEIIRNPAYATSVGLLLFGQRNISTRAMELGKAGGIRGAWQRISHWFKGNF